MRKLDHRMQILLDVRRHEKVLVEAKRRNVSVAEVIRDAIDRMPTDDVVRRAAVERILAAKPVPMPLDPMELRREIDEGHEREVDPGRQS